MRSVVAISVLCALSVANAESPLDGVWKLKLLTAQENNLTAAGEAKMAEYDYMTDDPALQCSPASFTRVVFTPQTYLEIRTYDAHVEIDYEFLDVRRRISLDSTLTTETAAHSVPDHPHLGRSIARFDGGALVIETAGYEPGVVSTLTAKAGDRRICGRKNACPLTERRYRSC
jgi:hypothetical protein